jgi:cytoskeletal protein CcmA (bactofilin family)
MWKKDESRLPGAPDISTAPPRTSVPSANPRETSAAPPVSGRAPACISQGIRIKGEITGSEDLFVDGPVEGKLQLTNGSLTVGPNGTVKADVSAREVIVRGRLEGKVSGRERVQLWSTGQVIGEVQTQRLAIEDGAVLRGKVETGKGVDKVSDDRSSASSSKSSHGVPVTTGSAVI